MSFQNGIVETIGGTPLIRLRGVSEETGCDILGKAEFMNPGGSVKDRAARAIVMSAEKSGALRPGGTVVEGTAGNTGIGLAHICNARGYRCVIVMPDNQSPEKFRLLEMLGARGAQGADRAVQQSQSIPEAGRATRGHAAGRDLGQPVRQHRQSRNPLAHHRPGDLGADGWPHRCFRVGGRNRRHGGRRFRVSQIKKPGRALRTCRSARQQPVRVRAQRRTARHRQLARSRKASA